MTGALPTRVRIEVTVVALCLAAAAALAGCGGSLKAASTPTGSESSPVNATTCGTPYTFTVDGRKVPAGSCAGLLPRRPPAVTVDRGDRFSLKISGTANGTRVTRAFPVPKPTGTAVVISEEHGLEIHYQAKTIRRSQLVVRSEFCPTDPKVSTCSVLRVVVGR